MEVLLILYAVCNVLMFAMGVVGFNNLSNSIEKNGLKVKHVLIILIFLPAFITIGIMYLLVYLIFFINSSKVNDLMNITIWRKKRD